MPTSEKSFYGESFGHWIARLFRISQTHIASKLAQFGIGRGQHSFLLVLFQQDGISQDYLARILSINKAAVARALLKLERSGYVIRQRDKIDRRNNLVYLTEKARSIKAPIFSILTFWTDVLANGFSDTERRQVITLLQRMSENAARDMEQSKAKIPLMRMTEV